MPWLFWHSWQLASLLPVTAFLNYHQESQSTQEWKELKASSVWWCLLLSDLSQSWSPITQLSFTLAVEREKAKSMGGINKSNHWTDLPILKFFNIWVCWEWGQLLAGQQKGDVRPPKTGFVIFPHWLLSIGFSVQSLPSGGRWKLVIFSQLIIIDTSCLPDNVSLPLNSNWRINISE